jgi:hypothetical protein
MRYRLRTLLIILALGPPLVASILGAFIEHGWEALERYSLLLVTIWAFSFLALIIWDWQRGRQHIF